jgi:hypothetical protein
MKRMLVTLGIAATAIGVFAQPPQNPTSAPTALTSASAPTLKKEKTQFSTSLTVFMPFTPPKPVVPKKIEHVDGLSSRPWAERVGWNPGESAFPRPELRDPSLDVFWVGHEPWH